MSSRLFTAAACVGAVSATDYTWDEEAKIYPQFADSDALAHFSEWMDTNHAGDGECAAVWLTILSEDTTTATTMGDFCDTTAFADAAAVGGELGFDEDNITGPTSSTAGCSTFIAWTDLRGYLAEYIIHLRDEEAICATASSAFAPSLLLGSVAALALRLL